MTDHLHETTKKIKQSLRLSMNGIVSAHQRRQGLDYKINFGVEIPRLKEIAAEYPKSKELAAALWKENIRECKLLAIFLIPQEDSASIAEEWIAEAPFTEIADHLSKNILRHLPDALHNALAWTEKEEGLFRYCGYLTITHLVREGAALTPAQEERLCKNINTLFTQETDSTLCRTAFTALCRYFEEDTARAAQILAHIPAGSTLRNLAEEYFTQD